MTRKILYGICGGAILSIIGLFLGAFIGMFIGGNFLPEFEFAGRRGYEAVGQIGVIVGTVIGALLGALLGVKLSNKSSK